MALEARLEHMFIGGGGCGRDRTKLYRKSKVDLFHEVLATGVQSRIDDRVLAGCNHHHTSTAQDLPTKNSESAGRKQ